MNQDLINLHLKALKQKLKLKQKRILKIALTSKTDENSHKFITQSETKSRFFRQ